MKKRIICLVTVFTVFLSLFCFSVSALDVKDIPLEYQYYADFRQDNADGSYIIRRIYTREPFHLLDIYSFPVIQNITFDSYIYTINYNNGKVDKNVSKGGSWSAVVDKNDILKGSELSIFSYLIYCNHIPSNLDNVLRSHPEFADILNKFFDTNIADPSRECPLELVKFEYHAYPNDSYYGTKTGSIGYSHGELFFQISNKSPSRNVDFYLTYDDTSYAGTETLLQSSEHQGHCKFNIKTYGTDGSDFVAKPGLNTYHVSVNGWLPYLDDAYFNFWLGHYQTIITSSSGGTHGGSSGSLDGDNNHLNYDYKCFATHNENFFEQGLRWDDNNLFDNNTGDLSNLPDSDFIGGYQDVNFKDVIPAFVNVFGNLQGIIAFYRSCFSIFPSSFWTIISIGLVLIIALRILGR